MASKPGRRGRAGWAGSFRFTWPSHIRVEILKVTIYLKGSRPYRLLYTFLFLFLIFPLRQLVSPFHWTSTLELGLTTRRSSKRVCITFSWDDGRAISKSRFQFCFLFREKGRNLENHTGMWSFWLCEIRQERKTKESSRLHENSTKYIDIHVQLVNIFKKKSNTPFFQSPPQSAIPSSNNVSFRPQDGTLDEGPTQLAPEFTLFRHQISKPKFFFNEKEISNFSCIYNIEPRFRSLRLNEKLSKNAIHAQW